jgi:hypothetical protein
MYAPISALQRSPASQSTAFGPPDYVKFAYPNSRLTLFCGVSRAPRMGRRSESLRPPAHSTVSTITAASVQGSLAGVSRNSSTHTLGQQSAQTTPALPTIPKMDFEKEALLEGGLMGLEFEDVLKGNEATNPQSNSTSDDMHGRSPVPDSKAVPSNKVAPEQVLPLLITARGRCTYVDATNAWFLMLCFPFVMLGYYRDDLHCHTQGARPSAFPCQRV